MRNLRFLSAALAALALSASTAYAQPDPPPVSVGVGDVGGSANDRFDADPPPVIQRVSALERENLLLKARVAALEKGKAAAPASADRWTIPQYPGVVFTKAQLTSMYPNVTFPTATASGVAGPGDPFACQDCTDNCLDGACLLSGCAAGCSSTRTTGVIGAGTRGTTLTYGLVPSGGRGTSTGAGCAATSGGTSGCSGSACGVQTQARGGWYLGKNLGR